MNKEPNYKIIIPITAIYSLLLFVPTIDASAIISLSIFSWRLDFSIAALLFPAIFPLEASLTEIYQKKYVYYVVFSSYLVTILFSLFNNFMLSNINNSAIYSFILAPSLTITIVGPISYLITSYININLLSKLKIKMRSRHFIIRNITCSLISGFIMSLIVQFSLFYDKDFYSFLRILISTVLIKTAATIFYVYLSKILVIIYRYVEGIDNPMFNMDLMIKNNGNLNDKAI
jgi:uncharacterized PurR-regulated membrane protein YhhQ (DUF165 family)